MPRRLSSSCTRAGSPVVAPHVAARAFTASDQMRPRSAYSWSPLKKVRTRVPGAAWSLGKTLVDHALKARATA